ncbi:TolB family protein, partial [Henriciella pelagia]|uniref:TolB family protein n=1 Tax=Henriciella pelagia TaxID=1977912 RepID=UPI003515B871
MRNLLIGGVALTALAACATPETTTAPLDAGTTAAATEAEAVPAVQSIEDFALIERAAIFGNAEKTQGRISPDGQYLSWIAPVDGVNNVWVAPASDPDAAKPVTNDTYRGISSHFWSPGSDYIYYTQDKGGDENFHVYASDVATGEVRDLTPVEDGTRAVIQGVSRNEPGKLLIGINDRNPQLFDLYLVDVATGEMELAAENPGYAGWLVDNSLTPRFGFMQTPGGGASIVDLEGNELVSIPAEDFLTTNPVGFNGANDAFYAVDSRGRDTAALVSIDTTTGEATVIAENDKADISDAMLHPVTYEPMAYASEY